MTKLQFSVATASADSRAISPTVRLHMQARAEGDPIAALALRARIQIEPSLRNYAPDEEQGLESLFGARERGARWITPLQWNEASTVVGAFDGQTEFDLRIPCTYDAHVTSSKYLTALKGGEIPVRIFFNGTIFRGAASGFQAEMLPWDLDCTARIPLQTWQDAMDECFPDQTWIRVDRATFDALTRYRASRALRDWDSTLTDLLNCRTP